MGGEVLKLGEDFLKERTQRVKVDGVKSREEKIKSGVPQGTVLGPVLFLVMIDDITDVVRDTKVASSIFADDTITELKLILGVIYRPPKCPYDKFQSVM